MLETWRCVAGNATHSYEVATLDRRADSFQLAVYQSPQLDETQRREIITIRVTEKTSPGLTGAGRSQSGALIQVQAFQKSVEFRVDDPDAGMAVGRCTYLTDWE
jgi:hypothetical protein